MRDAPPVSFRPQGRKAASRRFNAAIARACAQHPGCLFADAGPRLATQAGSLAPEHHRGDGLHLNASGYRYLIDTLSAAVRQHIPGDG